MSFIRAKEIPPHSGRWYDYEVMTTRVDGHVRQKVIQYLGKHGPDYSGNLIGDTGRNSVSSQNQSQTAKVSPTKKVVKTNKPEARTPCNHKLERKLTPGKPDENNV